MRNIRQIYQATGQHWVGDGFLVQPLFSHMADDRGTDPFLMLDYAAPKTFAPNSGRPHGVGQHPQGVVAHDPQTDLGLGQALADQGIGRLAVATGDGDDLVQFSAEMHLLGKR